MKKIFAFVLASIMVLSLVPASVFAAITKGCPDTHTVNNCEYTFVDKQDATCTKVGYTVYECKKCEEQFLADFVEMLEHTWVDNQKAAGKTNVPVNCKKKEDGKTWVKCQVCGAFPNGATTAAEGYIVTEWETAHQLGAFSGFGCEAKAKCSVCSGYFYGFDEKTGHAITSGAHTYEFTKVTSEPERVNGATTVGKALYTCKTCKVTKYVDIFAPDCRCFGFQDIYCTKIVDHKDATCEEKGTLAVYKCDDCSQLYSYNKSSKKYAAIEKIEDAEIAALGHTPKANTSTTVGCTTTYTCDRKGCGIKVTEKAHEANDPYIVVSTYSNATCVDYGYSVWLCNYCGWNEAKFEEPTGHDEKSFHIDATCANYGYTVTYCANETCHIVNEMGISVKNEPVTSKVIYGALYDVTIEDEDGNRVGVKVLNIKRDEIPNTSAHDYECIAANPVACGTAGYEVYKCKNCGNIYTKTLAPIQHEFDEEKTEYTSASCSQAGFIKKWCVNCEQYVTVATLPATPGVHNYEVVEIHSNCGTPTAATYNKNGIWYHTWEVYQCTGCTAQITVHSNPVGSSNVKTTFESIEEAELYHFGAAYLVNGEWVYDSQYDNFGKPIDTKASTCYTNGYALYQCGHCNQLVYVTLEKTAHPDAALIFHKANAATCTTAGNIAYYTCYICNSVVLKDEAGKQKTVTLADTVLLPHTQGVQEVIVKDCAGTVIGSYWICKQVNNKKECGKLFTDKTAAVEYTGVKEADAKKDTWTTIVPYVAATCNSNGTVGIEYCATCGKVRITENYIANNGAKKQVTKNSVEEAEAYVLQCYKTNAPKIDILVSANKTVTANTIVIPMFDHAYNADTKVYEAITSTEVKAKDCSKPGYTYNKCALCPFEYLDNYSPASSTNGHANKYGVSLVGDCGYLQDIKAADRVCFYCGVTVQPEHKNLANAIVVEATCSTDGYSYNYCVDCGYRVVKNTDVTFADADAFHADTANRVKVGVAEDYANAGDYYYACKVCGKALTKTTKVKCPGTGLEVVLSADAEDYIAGSTVKVTVALDSYNGVNVWGLNIPVTFNPAVFEFVGYEFNTDAFSVYEVNEIECKTIYTADKKLTVSDDAKSQGVISIAANASENVKVKGALTLVTLEFKVITAAAGEFDISVVELVEDVKVNTAKNPTTENDYVTKDFALDVVDEKGKALTNVLYDATSEVLKVNLKAFLNVDNDNKGLVNMADALALYEYIVFDEYDVVADANCDGKVTMEDLDILYDIITGIITVEDLINPIAE